MSDIPVEDVPVPPVDPGSPPLPEDPGAPLPDNVEELQAELIEQRRIQGELRSEKAQLETQLLDQKQRRRDALAERLTPIIEQIERVVREIEALGYSVQIVRTGDPASYDATIEG